MLAIEIPADPICGCDDDPQAAAELLRVLANERRLGVLCALGEGELSVSHLVERVGLSQWALSQHLARLRVDGVVGTRRSGRTILYRIADEEVLAILEAVAGVVARRRDREHLPRT